MAQNTISDELNRLIQAKAGIKSALEEKGLTIGDSSTLDEYPALIQEMEVGGGSSQDTSALIDLIERDITSLNIPEGTTKIGQYAFYNNSSLTNISIPNTVKRIEGSGFYGCSSLTNIQGMDQVSYLDMYAFRQCSKLEYMHLLNASVIADNAWSYCSKLNTVIIGDKITKFGQNIFSNTQLNNLVLLKNTPPVIQSNSFVHISSGTIYVKNSAMDSYKNAGGNWNNVSTKIAPLAAIDYDDTTYTVTALGRDNLELYVDASLCDSSVYTFTPGAEDASHVITVKSVDPSLGVLDTYTTEVLVEAAAPSYYAAPPTYTVGTPTYTYYQPSNCYKINLPVTFINAELQGYEGQYTTHRLLGLANDDHGSWYSDFSPVDDPDANPTKFYRYYQQNDTNTTLHLHNSVVVVYKDGNNNELYRTDSMNLDSSIVTDYWFKEQLSAPTIDIGQDRTEYFGEITSTDANADTIYYKINDGDWETVTGNTANIANGEISQGDIVYAYCADSNGNYLDSEIVSATPG